MIRMYEGNDPLEPYYNYVSWLEQSFPKIGRENNVVQLLEDVLVKFKDDEKYKQDVRLIQLLIKYVCSFEYCSTKWIISKLTVCFLNFSYPFSQIL